MPRHHTLITLGGEHGEYQATGTGNWQAQVRRRGIKPVTKTFKTKLEASRWARLLESEIDRGVFLDRSEAERTKHRRPD